MQKDNQRKPKSGKVYSILITCTIIFYLVINKANIYKLPKYSKENFSIIKDVIAYTNSHKENAYVYPNVLPNISLAYSIYEKIDDNTFSNLRHMGDWDIYNQEYYFFKERYNLNNIMEDLYLKDNLYIITGTAYGADNVAYKNHIDIIKKYIKQHFNKDVGYKVVKEFNSSCKVYKMYELKESEK